MKKIRISTFEADITPPVGHPLCAGWYPSATAVGDRLSALGLILIGEDDAPVVLCALDWAELGNREHRRWRQALADAAGTSMERVAVHCTHAHDTPWLDREAQKILCDHGHQRIVMDFEWGDKVVAEVAAAAAAAARQTSQSCTAVSCGQAPVRQIASNRRILGADGTVKAVRWTKTRDPEVRAEPEGLIDPMLKTISFWGDDRRIAALHYYAVHPTTIDGTGIVSPEFVGLARNRCTAADDLPHIYFTGCAGNVTAGKYNDGDPENRELFAHRITQAIRESERTSEKQPLDDASWRSIPITLPPRGDLDEASLLASLLDSAHQQPSQLSHTALMLSWLRRRDIPLDIACLQLNQNLQVIHLPGEAFIEYQLFAQACRAQDFVAVASYGDLGPGYICLADSFAQGGYEPTDSFCAPESEPILKNAIAKLLTPDMIGKTER